MSLLHHSATVQATPEETALRVARMQPLHLWHVDAIKQAFQSGIKKLLIGIWSADKKDTDDNPFTAEERKKMLIDVLQAEWLLDKCSIYYLTDLNNNALRRNQIDNELDDFYYLVSDNDYLKTLFADKQHITPVTRVNTRGTIIRNAIMQKDWVVLNKYLHPTTLLTLDEMQAQEKLEKIFGPEVKKPKNAVDPGAQRCRWSRLVNSKKISSAWTSTSRMNTRLWRDSTPGSIERRLRRTWWQEQRIPYWNRRQHCS
jgi:nicotinamide mononucleotide adenylyltransferase